MSRLLRASVDTHGTFGRQLTELERRQLPFATMQAINATAFETRQRWAEIMPKVFDRPTALTRGAVLYTKATRSRAYAEVFVRDEVSKGVPPSRYLQPQVAGGGRPRKGLERQLTAANVLPAEMYVVPGRGAALDQHGNLPLSLLNKVKSQLGAQGDTLANESAASRARRRRRAAKQGKRGGEYFALPRGRGALAAGVYERVTTGFGSAVRSVLRFVRHVAYRPRYRVFGIAQTVFERRFPANFERELSKAVASAWSRAFRR